MDRQAGRVPQILFRSPEILVAGSAFLFAGLVCAWLVRPLHIGTVGYDAAASVLYFERILAGRHLEAFVGATPKALLTMIYGVAFDLVRDWRVVSWLAIIAYGAAVAASAALGYRLGGGLAAGFVVVGMVGSAELLADADLAYAVTWALLGWVVAGLLVTASQPRYALAGVALAISGLARFETLIIVGLAGVLIAVGALAANLRGRSIAPFQRRLPILIGLLALPLQAVHDWLLTGDPWYAQSVPVLGSAGNPLIGVQGAIGFITGHYAAEPAVLLLAVFGLAALVSARHWDVLVGLVALGPGVAAFLVFLAARGIYVSDRYIAPTDLAMTFAAGIGLATILTPSLRELSRHARRIDLAGRPALALLIGSVVALALVRPFGPLDRQVRQAISVNGQIHRDLARVTPAIASAVLRLPGVRDWPAEPSPTRPTGSRAYLLVPVLTVPQLAVDLGLPLSSITGTVGSDLASDGSYPRPGQLVFHDLGRDNPADAFRMFEVDHQSRVGEITVRPILVDPHHFWLVEIGR